jgi:hypothetical protein
MYVIICIILLGSNIFDEFGEKLLNVEDIKRKQSIVKKELYCSFNYASWSCS